MSTTLWLFLSMIVFSAFAIWLRAVLDVWSHGDKFSIRVFCYENSTRLFLCAVGDVIATLMIALDERATAVVLEYLNFGWVSGAGAALGFLVGLLTVVFKKSAVHPLRGG